MPAATQIPAPAGRPETKGADRAGLWLAGVLLASPWLYRIEWDTTHVFALALVPALVAGRALIARGMAEIFATGWHVVLPLGVFAFAVVAGTARSSHAPASLVMASSWLLIALSGVLARQIAVEDPVGARRLLMAIAAGGALGTIAHWVCWRAGGNLEHAFYVHHRLMGLHALSSALASLALVLQTWEGRRAVHRAWLGIGIVAWGGLLWTGSRSPLVGIAVGLAVWVLATRRPERPRLLLGAAVLGGGGLLLSLCFWSPAPGIGWWHIWARTAQTTSATALTSNRSSFWADALQHVPSAPWFGHGPDAYGFLRPPLEGAQPHNLVLQLLLDVGVIGAVAAGSLIIIIMARNWSSRHSAAGYPVSWLALAAGSLASAQLDGYFFYPLALLPGVVALGACSAAVRPVAPPAQPGGWRHVLAHGWLPCAAAATVVLGFHCWLFQRVVHGTPPASPQAAVVRAWRAFPSVTYNVDFWIDAWADKFPDDALAVSRRAAQHAQSPAFFRAKTAGLLVRRGQYQEAASELELARAEAPPNERAAIDALLRSARAKAAR